MERSSIEDNTPLNNRSDLYLTVNHSFLFRSGEWSGIEYMHFEALEDEVRIEVDINGKNWYYPKCKLCGKEIKRPAYSRGQIYTCSACKTALQEISKEIREDEIYELKERKFENAVRRMSKGMNEDDFVSMYQESARKVYKKLHTQGWFDSTEEIMTAIELIRNGLKIKHHYKVGNYTPDFIIPSMRVVLEIDGKIYHTGKKAEQDAWRDVSIRVMLGEDWEVIRIPTDQINKNIRKLIPAIHAVVNERKKLRKENHGELPSWYGRGRIV